MITDEQLNSIAGAYHRIKRSKGRTPKRLILIKGKMRASPEYREFNNSIMRDFIIFLKTKHPYLLDA